MNRLSGSDLFLAFLLTIFLSISSIQPAAADGLDWLIGQSNPDGSFALTTDLSTATQATAETLRTLNALSASTPQIDSGLDYLRSETFRSTEYLSRRIIAEVESGNVVEALIAELEIHQNLDGGFGELPGFDSTTMDTTLALEALALSGQAYSQTSSYAINYLINQQNPDGSWALEENPSSNYPTALAIASLQKYRNVYTISASIDQGINFLQSRIENSGAIGEVHETALALLAITPSATDPTSYQAQIDYLTSTQLLDGSWLGDVYTTALVLRALQLPLTTTPAQPDKAIVAGQIKDAATAKPLVGVQISAIVDGTDTFNTTTDNLGVYEIKDLTPGQVSLTASLMGYHSVSSSGTASAGQVLNFSPNLSPQPQPVPISVAGQVIDADTGTPISGAVIQVVNSSYNTLSAGNGGFALSDIPAGSITVKITSTGYIAANFSVSAPAGGTFDLGVISLTPGTTSGNTGVISGLITDSISHQPLRGVQVSISGADNKTAYTGSDGAFSIADVNPGVVVVTASLEGYKNATGSADLAAGTQLVFNAELVKADNPALVTVQGSVVDAETQAALSAVNVILSSGTSVTTDASGAFLIAGVEPGDFTVTFELNGYQSVSYGVSAAGGNVVDLFGVALAPDVPITANLPPEISSTPPLQASVGLNYEYIVQASDPEGGPLTYGLSNQPAGMDIDPTNGAVSWIPTIDQTGPHNFTIVVSDSEGALAQQMVQVGVLEGTGESYVITDVQTLNSLTLDALIPNNYVLGSYVTGGRPGTWAATSSQGCGFGYAAAGSDATSIQQAADALDFWSMGSGFGSDAIWDMGVGFSTVSVLPLIDHAPFPQEGIEYTIWGSNDPNAPFPEGWGLATLVTIYSQGWADNRSQCTEAVNIDDYAGLYTFGNGAYQYIRLKADNSISIFDTPEHISWSNNLDDSSLPGWQSIESEIDGVVGMSCDVKPIADAGQDLLGKTGSTLQFDGTLSQGNIMTYGWDIDGDSEIDLVGANPSHVFNAGYDRDVTLYVVDDRGCVGTDLVHVTIDLEYPKPDLTVEEVNISGVVTDLQTLSVNGNTSVTVTNIGNAPAINPARITLFEDIDGNGAFDPSVDNALGSQTLPNGLNRDDSITIDVSVNGVVSFRDVPLHAMIDSDFQIDESNETNNTDSSSRQCIVIPDSAAFEPVLKWEWSRSGTQSSYNQVMHAPIVAPLEDTNQDGLFDDDDIPSVIFSTFTSTRYYGSGYLRAVSGLDGREIWTASTPVYPAGSLAAGDIDGDGAIEIIALREGDPSRNSTGVLAFEHTGALKWENRDVYAANWGGASLADIDNNGSIEIIIGNTVLNSNGLTLWQGNGYRGRAQSIVADVDLDGQMEVLAGASAYSHTGQIIWQNNAVGDGFDAVGNFDNDENPEIVVVSQGSIYLLEHSGEVIWGPVAIPGGGHGGPPTIADVDGDGKPEIGVAGARNYIVLDTNGAMLWASTTQDASSTVTGSSVFDFDGDGQVEIVYSDELKLRVYNGSDGTILFETPNTSGTTNELPVIVDIDNDQHAEIVVCSNNYAFRGSTGIQVFEDINDAWVDTRSIWNQHSYHITNINDDGTVPTNEQPSWLTHNTYRLNTFADRDPTLLSDLTASMIQVVDNGPNQPASISARIGNGGVGDLGLEIAIAFYEGDPASGGLLLGSVPVNGLASGSYRDVSLDNITNLSGQSDIHVIADYDNRLPECNEANNQVVLPVLPQTNNGSIGVATDTPVYGPNSLANLQASVMNTSSIPGEFYAELRVEDAQGNVVQSFPSQSTGILAGNSAVNLSNTWNTGTYQAGLYRLHGLLYSLDGSLNDESFSSFEIRHSVAGLPLAALRTTTDKPTYHTSDTARIDNLARNLASNAIIPDVVLRITVRNSSGASIYTQTETLGEILSGAMREYALSYSFVDVPEGQYSVTGELIDASGNVLASSEAQYEVIADILKALTGEVSVQQKTVERGQSQVCNDVLHYEGINTLSDQFIRQILVNLDTEGVIGSSDSSITLNPSIAVTRIRSINTSGFIEGSYACLLQAQISGDWITLAVDNFNLVLPPIILDASMETGDSGRVLVLLDGARECGKDDDDDEDDDHSNKKKHDDDDNDHDEDHDCSAAYKDSDPHGPTNAAPLSEQRAYLELFLTVQGWSYTIVTDADAFTHGLRSGAYNSYALLSEQVKLPELVQKELREAAFRGEGLLVAGDHDHRHNKLDDALGIKAYGSLQNPASIAVNAIEEFEAGDAIFTLYEKARRISLKNATAVAHYPGTNACDDDDEEDEDEHHEHKGKDKDEDDHDEHEQEQCNTPAIAVTLNNYGYGQSVYAGFDLLAQAAMTDADPLFTGLLVDALETIKPEQGSLYTGGITPIRLSISNQGIATPGLVTITLPDASKVLDPGTSLPQVDGSLQWPFDLMEDATDSLSFWLQLPDTAGQINIEALLQVGITPDLYEYDILMLPLQVDQNPDLTEVLDQLAPLSSLHEDYKDAYKKVEKAKAYLEQGKHEKALKEALKAADYLAELDQSQAVSVHLSLALAIRGIEGMLP